MDTPVIVAIIALCDTALGAVIAGLFSWLNHKNDKYRSKREAEEAEERRKREVEDAKAKRVNKAIIDMQFSMADCLDVLLRKAQGDRLNGEVREARTSLKKAKGRLNDLANEQLAEVQGGS